MTMNQFRPRAFMRNCVTALTIITSLTMTAQEKKLPSPSTIGGMPINAVIANRHSVREFDLTREINDSTLGQLLWMSVGVNRPDVQPSKFGAPANRSNPTARNWQEIHAFVFDKNGIWEYQPSSHTLTLANLATTALLSQAQKNFHRTSPHKPR